MECSANTVPQRDHFQCGFHFWVTHAQCALRDAESASRARDGLKVGIGQGSFFWGVLRTNVAVDFES